MSEKTISKHSRGMGFGALLSPKLELRISQETGNFIITCSHSSFWIDSATKKEDARLVLNATLDLLRKYPIYKFTTTNWLKWMKLHREEIPMVDAAMISLPGRLAISNNVFPINK